MVSKFFGRGPHKPFCDEFEGKLDNAIRALTNAQKFIDSQTKAIKDELAKLTGQIPSPGDDIRAAGNSIDNALKNETPDFTNSDDVMDVMKACGLMDDKVNLGGIANIVRGIIKQVIGAVANIFDDLQSSLTNIIEYPVAVLIKAINDLLSKIKIPDLLEDIDGFLDCIDAMCSRNISGKIDQVNNLIDGMDLNDSGLVDVDKLITGAGLTGTQKANIKSLVAKLETGEQNVVSDITDNVNVIKGVIDKVKGFF